MSKMSLHFVGGHHSEKQTVMKIQLKFESYVGGVGHQKGTALKTSKGGHFERCGEIAQKSYWTSNSQIA